MSHAGFVVPARKKQDIYNTATTVRNCFRQIIDVNGRLAIDVVYELMPDLMPGFELQIKEPWEMGDDHGKTYPDKKLICLRKDVYDGMCQGKGRDRFTGAHELGHLFLHTNVSFARSMNAANAKIYCCSEWQANTFASALLIDDASMRVCATAQQVADRLGVTLQAAEVRFRR